MFTDQTAPSCNIVVIAICWLVVRHSTGLTYWRAETDAQRTTNAVDNLIIVDLEYVCFIDLSQVPLSSVPSTTDCSSFVPTMPLSTAWWNRRPSPPRELAPVKLFTASVDHRARLCRRVSSASPR